MLANVISHSNSIEKVDFGVSTETVAVNKEGTKFIDLSISFGVFDILKCPEYGDDMNSYVNMRKEMVIPSTIS